MLQQNMSNFNMHKKYKPGLSTILKMLNSEPDINRERLKELADSVNKAEEQLVEKADFLKDCLEVHKEPESKKYKRRSLREDLGLTKKQQEGESE